MRGSTVLSFMLMNNDTLYCLICFETVHTSTSCTYTQFIMNRRNLQ